MWNFVVYRLEFLVFGGKFVRLDDIDLFKIFIRNIG